MEHIIEEFLKDCEKRFLSKSTISGYRTDLESLDMFISKLCGSEWMRISSEKLADLIDQFYKISGISKAQRIRTACREFYRYLNREGIFTNGHADSIPATLVLIKIPEIVDIDEVRSLPKRADNLRDRCILILLVDYVLLPSEICSINLSDFNYNISTLDIGEETLNLDKYTSGLLKEYIETEREKYSLSLFVTRSSDNISRRGVQNIVQKYSDIPNISCNTIRNTVAIDNFSVNHDFMQLHKILRHKYMRSTGEFLDRFYNVQTCSSRKVRYHRKSKILQNNLGD